MYLHSAELNVVAVTENVNTFPDPIGMNAREPLWR